MSHILHIKTDISGITNPIIGSFKILNGSISVGNQVKTQSGRVIGTIGKILSGSIMGGYQYVQEASFGEKVGIYIFSSYILTDKDTYLIVG